MKIIEGMDAWPNFNQKCDKFVWITTAYICSTEINDNPLFVIKIESKIIRTFYSSDMNRKFTLKSCPMVSDKLFPSDIQWSKTVALSQQFSK